MRLILQSLLLFAVLSARAAPMQNPEMPEVPTYDALMFEDGGSYLIASGPKTAEQKAAWAQLSDTQKSKFTEARASMLKSLAGTVRSTEGISGQGAVIKDKIFFQKNSQEIPAAMRGQMATQKIIDAVDDMLLDNMALVASSNEFGGTVVLGGIAEGGVGTKGVGGSAGIGLNFGWNKTEQAFVFEIFSEVDTFKQAVTPVFNVGVMPKAGIYVASRSAGASLVERGFSFYPPAAPGFVSVFGGRIETGLNAGLLSFPPSPFSDMMSYRNQVKHVTWLRVEASPTKGTFKFNSAIFEAAQKEFEKIARSQGWGRWACEKGLLRLLGL
jgi:hypothetical protein